MIELRNRIIWATASVLALLIWVFLTLNNQHDPGRHDPVLDSGIALFQEERFNEALKIFQSIPSDYEDGWRARYYEGSTHIMLKDYQASLAPLEESLALNSEGARILHALGVAYFKLGNLKLSKAYFSQVLELDPDDMEAKGLMDIMAKLERQASQNQPVPEEDSGDR